MLDNLRSYAKLIKSLEINIPNKLEDYLGPYEEFVEKNAHWSISQFGYAVIRSHNSGNNLGYGQWHIFPISVAGIIQLPNNFPITDYGSIRLYKYTIEYSKG